MFILVLVILEITDDVLVLDGLRRRVIIGSSPLSFLV